MRRNPNPNPCFFLAAVTAFYVKEDQQKQRTFNVLVELPVPIITKDRLGWIQKQAMARMQAENGVTPDLMRDIVILNISPLGSMPPEIFHGTQTIEGAIPTH